MADKKETKSTETSRYAKWVAFSTVFIAIVLVFLIFRTLKEIFIPLTFAIFISFLYAPIDRFLIKIKINVIFRVLTLITILFGITYMLAYLGFTGLARFIYLFPEYHPRLIELITTVGLKLRIPEESIQLFIVDQLTLIAIINTLSVNQIMGFIANNTFTVLTYYILTLFFTVFLLTDDRNFVMKLFQLFFVDKVKSEIVIRKIQNQLKVYILTKTFINLMGASLSATFIYFMRIDFPLLSAFLFFTFSFVPEIGSVVAALFPIMFCFLKYGVSWQLFVTVGALLTINSTLGNYIEPKLMGHRFNISPILIIFVLILWGWIWGPIGMLLAVPITVILNIIFIELDKFKGVRTIFNLRGDKAG